MSCRRLGNTGRNPATMIVGLISGEPGEVSDAE